MLGPFILSKQTFEERIITVKLLPICPDSSGKHLICLGESCFHTYQGLLGPMGQATLKILFYLIDPEKIFRRNISSVCSKSLFL